MQTKTHEGISVELMIQPVILSGGAGSRLWPFSRQAYPKQFLPLSGDKTLLQETLLRTNNLTAEGVSVTSFSSLIVCNESHRFLVAEQLRQIGEEAKAIILEPQGRNTAPALTLAAHLATEKDLDPILVVMPSDHLIKDQMVFRDRVIHAAKLAQDGYVVTFGIVPDKPETGFGYIRKGSRFDDATFLLDTFVEKPDQETAETYLQSGEYLWNSGIFVMRSSIWLEEIRRQRFDIAEYCDRAVNQGEREGDFYRIDENMFELCPSDSIDYAVMENLAAGHTTQKAVVLPLDAGWSDLGSWSAIGEVLDSDDAGNVIKGDVFSKDTHNSLLCADSRFLAAVGVNDIVIVETNDAVLVAHKDKVQDVKLITEYLKGKGRSEHIFHAKVHESWGKSELIDQGSGYLIKRLTLDPGASLSIQIYDQGAKHWVVMKGNGRLIRGSSTFLLGENDSTNIPRGVENRLENTGTIALEIIEIQSESDVGDGGVSRFKDHQKLAAIV